MILLQIILFFISSFSGALKDTDNSETISIERLAAKVKTNQVIDTFYIKSITLKKSLVIENQSGKSVVILPEEKGGVIISGNGSIVIKNSENITFSGFLFDKTNRNTIIIDNSKSICIKDNYFFQCGNSPSQGSIIRIRNSSSDNRIYCNTFEDNRAIGITLSTSDNNVNDKGNVRNKIYNNIFFNVQSVKKLYPESNGNGLECIQLGSGGASGRWWNTGTEIYNNLFQDITGDGVEIISNKTSGSKIYGNSFIENNSGITVRYGNNVEILDNLLYNTKRGIRAYGKGHKIEDNVLIGGDVGLLLPSATFQSGTSVYETNVYYQSDSLKIANNLLLGQRLDAISIGDGQSDSRKFLPKNIKFERNKLVVSDVSRFARQDNFELTNIDVKDFKSKNSIVEKPNTLIKQSLSGAGLKKINVVTNLKEILDEIVEVDSGVSQFRILSLADMSIGAQWKRPNFN